MLSNLLKLRRTIPQFVKLPKSYYKASTLPLFSNIPRITPQPSSHPSIIPSQQPQINKNLMDKVHEKTPLTKDVTNILKSKENKPNDNGNHVFLFLAVFFVFTNEPAMAGTMFAVYLYRLI